MSGHSKWATIKHAKGAADAKRGKLFSRISKMITIAVKEGGNDDPAFNPSLRVYVDKAKMANMPKEKIQNAIDKGAGRVEGAVYEEVVYEGFGPFKVAVMIECVTDNRNRTNSEIRMLVNKNEGVLGSKGSVGYFFDRKGIIQISIPEGKEIDEFELELMNYEVEDLMVKDGVMNMIVESSKTNEIVEKLKSDGFDVVDSELAMIPNSHVELNERQYELFMRFFNTIDDYEDIQKIYHNAKKSA